MVALRLASAWSRDDDLLFAGATGGAALDGVPPRVTMGDTPG